MDVDALADKIAAIDRLAFAAAAGTPRSKKKKSSKKDKDKDKDKDKEKKKKHKRSESSGSSTSGSSAASTSSSSSCGSLSDIPDDGESGFDTDGESVSGGWRIHISSGEILTTNQSTLLRSRGILPRLLVSRSSMKRLSMSSMRS